MADMVYTVVRNNSEGCSDDTSTGLVAVFERKDAAEKYVLDQKDPYHDWCIHKSAAKASLARRESNDAAKIANELTDAVWALRDTAQVRKSKTSIWDSDGAQLTGQILAYTKVLELLHATRHEMKNPADQSKHLIDL